jgi:thymidylate kinase
MKPSLNAYPYPLINISGGDRRGKETQSKLLTAAIKPSTRIEFPNYSTFAGQLIRGALFNEEMTLTRHTDKGDVSLSFQIDKPNDPMSFQLLQNICRYQDQERIGNLLMQGYVFADRYQLEAIAYGTEDGCDLRWIMNGMDNQIQETLAVIFMGRQFPKPGEKADMNERDTGFQKRVMDRYKALATLVPEKYVLFDIDRYRRDDLVESIYRTHCGLVELLRNRLKASFSPLSFKEVEQLVGAQSPQLRLDVEVQ